MKVQPSLSIHVIDCVIVFRGRLFSFLAKYRILNYLIIIIFGIFVTVQILKVNPNK